jgi:hypothetical protein
MDSEININITVLSARHIPGPHEKRKRLATKCASMIVLACVVLIFDIKCSSSIDYSSYYLSSEGTYNRGCSENAGLCLE